MQELGIIPASSQLKDTPMKNKSEWPYDDIFDAPRAGLCMQEHISYEKAGRSMVKKTVTRRYYGENDYQDTTKTEVLYATD